MVVTAETHSVIGGLGSAVAEAIPEAGRAGRCGASACRTDRRGILDGGTLEKHGLSTES